MIPAGRPPVALLRPVATRSDLINGDDVRCLTEWRNRHVTAFLTEFQATESQTARWLTETVAADAGKILFMVDDLQQRTFGYMGLAFIDWDEGYGEADAVVRGRAAAKGTMAVALSTLLAWARGQLRLETLGVRVRSDNVGALSFYEKVGFREQRRAPLRRTEAPGLVRWVDADEACEHGVSLVHMRLGGGVE